MKFQARLLPTQAALPEFYILQDGKKSNNLRNDIREYASLNFKTLLQTFETQTSVLSTFQNRYPRGQRDSRRSAFQRSAVGNRDKSESPQTQT